MLVLMLHHVMTQLTVDSFNPTSLYLRCGENTEAAADQAADVNPAADQASDAH
jgi:hypothetical protein